MAQECIFCGKEIGLFSRENTVCGGVEQPTCLECYKLLRNLSQKERGERALATGRAVNPEQIAANLAQAEQKEKADRERQEKARQALRTGEKCLRCGGAMERCGLKRLHLGEEGLFGPVARDGLLAAWLEVDVHRCAQCGRGEFYLPQPPEIPSIQEEEQVTCPVCGARHSPDIGCPRCAMNNGQERWTAASQDRPKKPSRKPPWEK